MAIVETLEIRFLAKLGGLGGQIAAVTAALGGLGAASTAVLGAVTGSALMAGGAFEKVNLSTQEGEKRQARLASRLKKTSRALKGVSSAAEKAAGGIGLHKLDEINLVGGGEKRKYASGGKQRIGADFSGALKGVEKLRKALETMPGFFTRLRDNFKTNLSGLDGWLNSATGGLAGMLAKSFGFAGSKAALSLVDRLLAALNTSRPDLAAKGKAVLQTLCNALKNGAAAAAEPSQAGSALTGRLAKGLLSGKTAIRNAAVNITNAAKFGGGAAGEQAKNAGANLSKGFYSGMLSYLQKIKDAASSLANAALGRIKSLLKIASPSKVAFSMGGFFSEGFADGIVASAAMAGKGASLLADGAVSALAPASVSFGGESGVSGMVRAAVNEALGATSIVVPLHVDGVKLGEASIRGINRVTRAAGRLMLEI